MNIHISEEIRKEWPQFEFLGQRRKSLKYGFEYIKAKHLVLDQTFFYVFGANSFVDENGIKNGAPELIFNE